MQELETISKMVLDKQGERPMLIIAWGRFLKMFHECYPESRLTLDAADGAKAGEILRYWQHDETGRQCAGAQRPSPRWFEITQGQYDGSDDDYPAKPPRR